MKHFLQLIATASLSALMLLATPSTLPAQTRGERNQGQRTEHSRSHRNQDGGSSRRASARPAQRKDNDRKAVMQKHDDRHGKPGNNRPADNRRPGGNKKRPDKGHGANPDLRPGPGSTPGGNGPAYRPGAAGHRPGHGPKPGGGHGVNRPPRHPAHHPPVMRPPHRPGRPGVHHFRPTPPPPRWRPAPGRVWFNTVVGLAPGLSLSLSLDRLFDLGITVDAYASDAIYLRNISQLGFNWPEATLVYNAGGLLDGVQLFFSTSRPNLNRYNNVYSQLLGSYGPPYDLYDNGSSLGATWWGPDGRFITLDYSLRQAADGTSRWFTTLSFGR